MKNKKIKVLTLICIGLIIAFSLMVLISNCSQIKSLSDTMKYYLDKELTISDNISLKSIMTNRANAIWGCK